MAITTKGRNGFWETDISKSEPWFAFLMCRLCTGYVRRRPSPLLVGRRAGQEREGEAAPAGPGLLANVFQPAGDS